MKKYSLIWILFADCRAAASELIGLGIPESIQTIVLLAQTSVRNQGILSPCCFTWRTICDQTTEIRVALWYLYPGPFPEKSHRGEIISKCELYVCLNQTASTCVADKTFIQP
jgi:hypothetical protein